ncbi:hypothetical protein, partial [Gemmobacter caeruleus]|uniref:hypothetical protein n=1 Tax=Gemmobacter caeruleus TaxID=2595004 RepID=UPI00193A98ED
PSPLRNKTHKREADTHIIAEASEPICKRPPSKTTKPPAYPFISINVKEHPKNKNQHRASYLARRQPHLQSRFSLNRCGEAASRPTQQNPQAKNHSPNAFSSPNNKSPLFH